MMICVPELLSKSDLETIGTVMSDAKFVDGGETARGKAKAVKNNEQISKDDPKLDFLRKLVLDRLMANQLFKSAVRPKMVSYILFSKYTEGMSYGTHIDNPLMSLTRTDVSFTIFLNDPDEYDGGELVLQSPAGDQPIKLPAGCGVFYPSTTLHNVTEVTRGERNATVGWIRSYIRDPAKREMLFDIDNVKRGMADKPELAQEYAFLLKTAGNLFRMWCDD